MTTHALTHDPHDHEHASLARWLAVGAVSGGLAVIIFHQALFGLLHALGMTPSAPYSMQRTSPFGVAQLWSIVFWGALWGVALAAALRRFAGASLIAAATIFGAILPSLVAWTVVASLKGQPLFAGGAAAGIAVGLLVNAAWGLGTGIGLTLLGRPHGRLAAT